MYEVLFALTLIFVVASALLLVATRLSLPVIPFYLLSGIVVGLAIDETQLIDLAQWGIAFLVFLFGVHVDLESFRSTGRLGATVAVVQAAIVGAFGVAVGIAFGLDWLNATYFGVAAALSSSMVAVSYLDDVAKQVTFERVAGSIHFVEDVLGVGVVLALSALVYAPEPAATQFAVAGGLFALALVLRYAVFHRLVARIRGDEEVTMLVGVAHVVGFIALAEFAGLSIVVGAFAAGIAIADDYPLSLELVDTVDDLGAFFTPIFFVTLGALLTVPSLETLGYATVLIATILVVNPLLVALILLRSGFDSRTAVLTGWSLDHASAFALFVALEAAAAETIVRPVFDAIVLAAVVTMIVGTITDRHREAVNRRLHDWGILEALAPSTPEQARVADDLSDHVIVVGSEFGGARLFDVWSTVDRPVLVIEDDPVLIDEVRERSDHWVYGDVLDDGIWEVARVEDAALVVSLTPEADRAEAVVDLDADVPRIVRVDDRDTAREYVARGVDGVLHPDAVAGEHVARDVEALLEGDRESEEQS